MPTPTPTAAKKKCKARSKSTDARCRNWAVTGLEVCRMHGGSPKSPKVAAKRARAIEGAWTRRLDGRAGADLAPIEHLVDELHRSSHVVAVLSSVVAEDDDIVDELPTAAGGRSRSISVEYAAWERERDRHARLAEMCLDAGVAERVVRVAESQAEAFAGALQGILSELGVADHPGVGEVVRHHMLAIESGESS